jgi:beta-lactamase regulating signal transducer with metallopeptidase domain
MTEYGFHPQGLERLAGSLLHFIWQGALVAFVTAVLLKILEKRTAALRYAISLAALGTMLLCASLTFAFYEETGSATLAVLQFLDRSAAQASRSANAQDVAAWTTWIVLAWGAGVAIFAGRLLAGSLLSFRLVRNAQTAIPEEVSRLIERVGKMLPGHRRVQLRISGNVDTPVVFGWLRPVILLPVIVTTGLAEVQLLVRLCLSAAADRDELARGLDVVSGLLASRTAGTASAMG